MENVFESGHMTVVTGSSLVNVPGGVLFNLCRRRNTIMTAETINDATFEEHGSNHLVGT